MRMMTRDAALKAAIDLATKSHVIAVVYESDGHWNYTRYTANSQGQWAGVTTRYVLPGGELLREGED